MKDIQVNIEYLEALAGRLHNTLTEVNDACHHAILAEEVCNPSDSKTIENTYRKTIALMELLVSDIDTVVNGFNTEDAALKAKADELGEALLGTDAYNHISSGDTVNISSETGEIISVDYNYSTAVQNYIYTHLEDLKKINASNYTNWMRSGEWCDAFVDYILRESHVPSPGDTNGVTTELFEMNDWRHGLKFDNGDWSEFNNSTPTPGGARISNDGYQPKTGDLVWGSYNLTTDHVGIYYVDPVTKVEYVLEGNTPDTSLTPAQDFYNRYRHVSYGDIGAFVNSLGG